MHALGLPVISFLVIGSFGDAPRPLDATGYSQPRDTMVATVQSVSVQDSTFSVVYGTSLALRVVHMVVAPGCRVSVGDGEAALPAIRPGQVVRVVYRTVGSRLVADVVEVVRSQAGGP